MATQKITLSVSRDIPFDKLLLSGCNVRRIKAGVSIQELADDIARRTLLQSLTVRPVLDADGRETGMYEIPAGGRRYRALELLVKQKRLAKTAPIPCVIRLDGIAEEDSLAENVQRAPLHPLDQFRAFLALRERGQSEEEIAANFFVSVAVVRQRLRLASVSPKLLDAYAEDAMTLDQLMAFTVSADHERQEQAWERLQSSYTREPYMIRRVLTESAVRASDKRARFIGEAYEAAGGAVLRDLFQGDDGGWLQDVGFVDRLVAERLEREADAVRAEGWHWIEVAPDFPYGHQLGLRRLRGEAVALTAGEAAEREALQVEYDGLEETHADIEDLPEEVDRRLAEIESALAAFERPAVFAPAEMARAGAFVGIDGEGRVRVERGYVRPEDELPIESEPEAEPEARTAVEIGGGDGGCRTDRGDAGTGRVGRWNGPCRTGGCGGAGGGRGHQAAVRPAADRIGRAPDAGPAPRGGWRAAPGAAGRAARALPQAVLPLCARHLPGARRQERGFRGPGAGAEGHRPRPDAGRAPPGLGGVAAGGSGSALGRVVRF